jgi:hypothetical protein
MGPKLRNKAALRSLSLGIATYIFIVISLVHLTHTCNLGLPTNLNKVEFVSPGGNSDDPKTPEADGPCLACMFLSYLKATAFAALIFTLCIVLLAQRLSPTIPSYFILFSLSRHIRGPPALFSPGIQHYLERL